MKFMDAPPKQSCFRLNPLQEVGVMKLKHLRILHEYIMS